MSRCRPRQRREELELSGWVRKRGKHYLLDLGRLEEPGYAEYFEEVARRIAIAKNKLSELNISGSAPTLTPKTE
jgi:hypothetical protein